MGMLEDEEGTEKERRNCVAKCPLPPFLLKEKKETYELQEDKPSFFKCVFLNDIFVSYARIRVQS